MMCNKYITAWNKRNTKIYSIKKYVQIAILSVLFFSFNGCKKSLITPKKDDVYIINKKNTFTTIKIVSIENNRINYLVNDYNVSDKKWIGAIEKSNNYSDSEKSTTLKDFKKIINH